MLMSGNSLIISAYRMRQPDDIWWLLLITAAVLSGFFLMFRRIVDRYCSRIASMPANVQIWHTFPLRGWILLVFMMGLGIALKHIPQVPSVFSAGLELLHKSYLAVVTRLSLRAFVGVSQTDADDRSVAFAESESGKSFRRVDEEADRTSEADRTYSQ